MLAATAAVFWDPPVRRPARPGLLPAALVAEAACAAGADALGLGRVFRAAGPLLVAVAFRRFK